MNDDPQKSDSQAESEVAHVPAREVSETVKIAEREQWRAALRDANCKVWVEGPSSSDANLDTSLKRNSAFIKRLKQPNLGDAKDALLREVYTLSLAKYLDELVPSVPEVLWKNSQPKDRYAVVEILSALHARFGGAEFSCAMLKAISQELVPLPPRNNAEPPNEQAQKEEALKVTRQRNLLRGATELVLVGLGGPVTGNGRVCAAGWDWLYEQLRTLLGQDRDLAYLPLVQGMMRTFGSLLLIPMQEHEAGQSETHLGGTAAAVSSDPVVPEAQSQKFRKLFEMYYIALVKRVKREYERLNEQERRNNDAYIRSGMIFEDRQAAFERRSKELQTMIDAMQVMASSLNVFVPDLPASDKGTVSQRLGINLEATSALAEMTAKIEQEYASGKSPWEDEETRKFYKDIFDLRERIPTALLDQAPQADEKEKEKEALNEEAEMQTTTDNRSQSLQNILERLPTLANRTMVDDMAVELGFHLKSVTNKRLVSHFMSAPKHRWDLLPYYARMIAILHPYRAGLADMVVEQVNQKFRQQYSYRKPDRQMQSNVVICMGELTKFGLVPDHIVFHTMKVLLDDFSPVAIEMLALLIETCGRYLYRMPLTMTRMQSMLDLMRRKRMAHNLSEQHSLLLDNAYYKCVPPERPVIVHREPTVMEQFITYLFTNLPSPNKTPHIRDLLLKLDWHDESIRAHLFMHFTSPWLVQHNNVRNLAELLNALRPMRYAFTTQVLDSLSEGIEADLLHLHFAWHQRRISRVRYLGELHRVGIVGVNELLNQVWRFCSRRYRRRDPRDDFTRVRLVCTLLPYCHSLIFDRPYDKRLRLITAIFQYYVQTKVEPPVEVAYLLQDTVQRCGLFKYMYTHREHLQKVVEDAVGYFSQQDLSSYVMWKKRKAFMQAQRSQMHVNIKASVIDNVLEGAETKTKVETERDAMTQAIPETGDSTKNQLRGSARVNSMMDVEPDLYDNQTRLDDEMVLSRQRRGTDAKDELATENAFESGIDVKLEDEKDMDAEVSDEQVDVDVEEDEDEDEGEDRECESEKDDEMSVDLDDDHEEDELLDDEEVKEQLRQEALDEKADAELEQELAMLMADSGGNVSGAPSGAALEQTRLKLSDTQVPRRRAAEPASDQHMVFSLLSRKHTQDIQVPSEASISVHARQQQAQAEAERKQLKAYVLAYREREEQA